MRIGTGLLGILAALPGMASAETLRDYCPDRPGLGTPACTIDRGHASFELGLADWTRDRTPEERSDTLVGGDALLRLGLTDSTELQLGWTSYGRIRELDRLTGDRSTAHGTGDVGFAVRQNLRNPDGSGLSIALMPSVTLPVGGRTIGAGDWGAAIDMPMSYELGPVFALALTTQIAAAVDEDRDGRHLAYGEIVGVSAKLGEQVTATLEAQAQRDRDPDGPATLLLAGLSLGWQPADNWQIDVGSNAGLNHASPDVQVYFGVSRRF